MSDQDTRKLYSILSEINEYYTGDRDTEMYYIRSDDKLIPYTSHFKKEFIIPNSKITQQKISELIRKEIHASSSLIQSAYNSYKALYSELDVTLWYELHFKKKIAYPNEAQHKKIIQLLEDCNSLGLNISARIGKALCEHLNCDYVELTDDHIFKRYIISSTFYNLTEYTSALNNTRQAITDTETIDLNSNLVQKAHAYSLLNSTALEKIKESISEFSQPIWWNRIINIENVNLLYYYRTDKSIFDIIYELEFSTFPVIKDNQLFKVVGINNHALELYTNLKSRTKKLDTYNQNVIVSPRFGILHRSLLQIESFSLLNILEPEWWKIMEDSLGLWMFHIHGSFLYRLIILKNNILNALERTNEFYGTDYSINNIDKLISFYYKQLMKVKQDLVIFHGVSLPNRLTRIYIQLLIYILEEYQGKKIKQEEESFKSKYPKLMWSTDPKEKERLLRIFTLLNTEKNVDGMSYMNIADVIEFVHSSFECFSLDSSKVFSFRGDFITLCNFFSQIFSRCQLKEKHNTKNNFFKLVFIRFDCSPHDNKERHEEGIRGGSKKLNKIVPNIFDLTRHKKRAKIEIPEDLWVPSNRK